MYKNMFLYEKTHRYLKNDYQFFDALETKDCEIRGICNLLTKVKFHELEWSCPLNMFFSVLEYCLQFSENFLYGVLLRDLFATK